MAQKKKEPSRKLYDDLKRFVLKNYENAKTNSQKFFDNVDKWNDQYDGLTNEKAGHYPQQSTVANIFSKETFNAVQTVKSRLLSYIYEEDEFDIAENSETPPEIRGAYLEFMKRQREFSKHRREMEKFCLTLLKQGTAVAKHYWETEIKKIKMPLEIPDIDPRTGFPVKDEEGNIVASQVKLQEVEAVVGYPYFKNLNIKNVFFIGDTDNFYKLDGVMEVIENVSWDDLWRLRKHKKKLETGEEIDVGIYENLDYAIELNLIGKFKQRDEDKAKQDTTGLYVNNPVVHSKEDPKTKDVKHKLIEFWCSSRDIGNGKKEPCVITLLDEEVVIRVQENPFKHKKFPYLYSPCFTQENALQGIGFCRLVEDDQYEINTKRNQMLDNVTMAINNMWIRRDPNISDSQLKSRPGGIIDTLQINGVEKLTIPMMDMNAGLTAVRMLQDGIATTTGATRPMQGEKIRGRGTAFEVNTMVQEGSYKIVDIMHNLEDHVLYPDLYMSHTLNRQFTDKVIVQPKGKMEVTKPDGTTETIDKPAVVLYKKDFDFEFEFKIDVATKVENRTIKNQKMENFLLTLQRTGLPPQIIGLPMYELIKRIWINLGLDEVETIFPPENEQIIRNMFQMPQPQGQPEQSANVEESEKNINQQATKGAVGEVQ